jgi:hypothetical protein
MRFLIGMIVGAPAGIIAFVFLTNWIAWREQRKWEMER